MLNRVSIFISLSFFTLPIISFAAALTEENSRPNLNNLSPNYLYEEAEYCHDLSRPLKRRKLNNCNQAMSKDPEHNFKIPVQPSSKVLGPILPNWMVNEQFTPETRASGLFNLACRKLYSGQRDEAFQIYLKLTVTQKLPLVYREKSAFFLATLRAFVAPWESAIILEMLLDSKDLFTSNASKLSLGHIYARQQAFIAAADLYRELAQDKEALIILRASAARNFFRMVKNHNDDAVLSINSATQLLEGMLLISGIDNKDKSLITKMLEQEWTE